jgi:uncharacterized protein YjbJ (UPF0337 family)
MGSIMDKIKGKAKEIEGRATGDKVRTGQGKLEKQKANVKSAAARATSKVKAGVTRAKTKARTAKARRTRARAV